MNPTVIIIAEALMKYGPSVARALVEIFKKDDPTAEDWEKVFALAEKSYDDYVPPVVVNN
jgi:hypothetical protein